MEQTLHALSAYSVRPWKDSIKASFNYVWQWNGTPAVSIGWFGLVSLYPPLHPLHKNSAHNYGNQRPFGSEARVCRVYWGPYSRKLDSSKWFAYYPPLILGTNFNCSGSRWKSQQDWFASSSWLVARTVPTLVSPLVVQAVINQAVFMGNGWGKDQSWADGITKMDRQSRQIGTKKLDGSFPLPTYSPFFLSYRKVVSQ